MKDEFISRQAAIDTLIEWYGCEPTDIEDFKSIIEKAPPALPKEHGRLIDADALIKSIEKKSERLKNLDTINGLCGAINLIYDAPTVIEADKEG